MRSLTLATSLSLLPACAVAGGDRYHHHLVELRDATAPAAGGARLDERELFPGAAALDRRALVDAVLVRNPSIETARLAWREALAEFPHSTALADPMASYMFAPASIGTGVPFGQEVMLTQAVPFPGKLGLRGAAALAEADAARGDFHATRLGLTLMASMLHADYFKNAQELTVNDEHATLLASMRGALQGRFEAGEETLQGPLEAELELAHVEHDRVRLLSERDVIVTRINELLHREPAAPLPPPPSALEAAAVVDAAPQALFEEALAKRPEIASVRARITAAQAEIDLAQAESWPDFSVSASYNSMWSDVQHQFMVGGSIDIPIQLGRRAAALEQAELRRRRQDNELSLLLDAVRAEVESERRRVLEGQHLLSLFDDRMLPVAQAIVDAAQAGVATNRTSFLELLEAERALRSVKLARAAAVAALHQQLAKLDRVVGRVPSQ